MRTALTLACASVVVLSLPVYALSPSEVAVVYDSHSSWQSESRVVADYYCQARGIAVTNEIGVSWGGSGELIPPVDYVGCIVTPLWNNYLSQPAYSHIKAIVTCYGIPSRISVASWPYACGLDAALALLGNPCTPDIQHWFLSPSNPYYNSTLSWDEFRDSAANAIYRGGGLDP